MSSTMPPPCPTHHHAASPRAMLRTCRKHRSLLWQITKRDITARYRGSALGMVWSFVIPLLMLAVYTFVFGVVFNARFGDATTGEAASTTDFALTLFCGLMIHTLFSECLTRNPTLILHHANFVKKVVFPLEILPIMVLGSALFHFLMHVLVLLAGLLLTQGALSWTVLLLPLTLLPMLPLLLGMGWILASLGVYLRDIAQLTGLLSTLLLFLSPIFYPIDALPEAFRPFLYLNPLTPIIEATRQVVLYDQLPNMTILLYYSAASLAMMLVGFWWFQKTRNGFADIL